MEVFISWSGEKSKSVAKELRSWLPYIIQQLHPWMSEVDIGAGARWNNEVGGKLKNTNFGIICLTKDNLNAPWIYFEAGALSKSLGESHVCPYLIDIEPDDLPQGPLTQFQAKRANEEKSFDLIETINNLLTENKISKDRLRNTFDRFWPDCEKRLKELSQSSPLKDDNIKRTTEDKISEILEIARDLARRLPDQEYYDLSSPEEGYFFPSKPSGIVLPISNKASNVRSKIIAKELGEEKNT